MLTVHVNSQLHVSDMLIKGGGPAGIHLEGLLGSGVTAGLSEGCREGSLLSNDPCLWVVSLTEIILRECQRLIFYIARAMVISSV